MSTTTNENAAALVTLQPMCAATENLLRQFKARETDFLLIDSDKDARGFRITPVSMVAVTEDAAPASIEVNGTTLANEAIRLQPLFGNTWPSYQVRSFLANLPEQKELQRKDGAFADIGIQFAVAATDITCLILQHCWPATNVVMTDEARLMYRYQLTRFYSQTSRAVMNAAFKVSGKLPEMPSDLTMVKGRELAPYQRAALVMATGTEAFGLLMDPGTGKTPIVVSRVSLESKRKRQTQKKMYRALIVCPLQVRTNWAQEFKRFSTNPGKITLIKGGEVDRARAIVHSVTDEPDCDWSASIIGYETLATSSIDFIKRIPWDLVVLDESHRGKSSRTKRFERLLDVREAAKSRMILTGTPIGNSIMDLWSQLEFLGEGLSGFTSFSAFQDFYGNWETPKDTVGVRKLASIKNCAVIQERLARLTFSIDKEEAGLNLPDKVSEMYEVEMTPKQAEIYAQVAEQLALEIEEMLGDTAVKREMVVENILVKLLRLAQITSGHLVYPEVRDPDTGVVLRERVVNQIDAVNPKVEGLMEIIQDEGRDPRSKIVVWCCFVPDIQAISKRLTEAGINHGAYYGATTEADREKFVKAFNEDPSFRVLICNPQTAGEGLNLVGYDYWNEPPKNDTYCDTAVFFSSNWSYLQRAQAEDRAHRRGTRMPVRIIDLIVPDTIDQEIRQRLAAKKEMADLVTDIQDILKNVMSYVK